MLRPNALLLLSIACAACGRTSESAPAPRAQAGPAAGAPVAAAATPGAPVLPRSRDPRVLAAARAFDHGDRHAAESALLALGSAAGIEGELLRARLAAAGGDDVAAVRTLESARASAPSDDRVFAAAAEIHAAAARFESAESEIRGGLAAAGPTAEIERARGVLLISQPGGAKLGLDHLLAALRTEPDLPYADSPLRSAHLLLASQALAKKAPADAIAHAQAALELFPGDREASLALADACVALGDIERALPIYEDLREHGVDQGASLPMLYQTAAVAALLRKDRSLAAERYLRARELGLSDAELGFGVSLLAEESGRHVDLGAADYDAAHYDEAECEFREALRLDPGSLAARNHLGVVLFRRDDPSGAADCWRAVLSAARAAAIELPDPVELNLARALFKAGRLDELRTLLDEELARDPPPDRAAVMQEMQRRLAAR